MSKQTRPTPTKFRILEAARELFNRRGATEVTTHDIAAACRISPGNLYYHYANKEEIIRALFARSLEENVEFQKAQAASEAPPGEKRVRGLDFAKEISWRYRFFKRELPALLARDPELAKSFRAFHRRHLAELRRDIDEGVQLSGGQGLRPEESQWLAEVSWLMVLFWPSFVEVGGARSTRREMDRGIDLISWLFDRVAGNERAR
ncbi:MAG: TetR/AcrR family transcriptional regulator [Terrimicrobiaceae bacterium]